MVKIPRDLVVIGGGVIGTEYASMFAALGVNVTIVDARKRLLGFVDEEIIECLQYQLRALGVLPFQCLGKRHAYTDQSKKKLI